MSRSAGVIKVFVHGNPETRAVWAPLLTELGDSGRQRTLCLSPPGFGAPLPSAFGCTVEDYRAWLVTELEALGEPVDLVGHDWGGGHVVNVAMTRPDLLRSWVSDAIGIFDPDYVWHDLARQWQTPHEGEALLAELFAGSVEERARRLAVGGITRPVADHLAAAQNDEMARAILELYRSARQPVMAKLGRRLEAAGERPGLVLLATEDHNVGSGPQRRRCAERSGAGVAVLQDRGHWWMVEDPHLGAATLAQFWSTLAA